MGCRPQSIRYPIPRAVQQVTRFNRMGQTPYTKFRIFPGGETEHQPRTALQGSSVPIVADNYSGCSTPFNSRCQPSQDTPSLWHGSAHFTPASCSCNIPIIFSSENLVRFIVCPLVRANSNPKWRKLLAPGHLFDHPSIYSFIQNHSGSLLFQKQFAAFHPLLYPNDRLGGLPSPPALYPT